MCFELAQGYLRGVRKLCDKYNVLFIADEVGHLPGSPMTMPLQIMNYVDTLDGMIYES